jgi:hypothetical protein
MGGKDPHAVRQGEQLLVQGAVQGAGQLVGGHSASGRHPRTPGGRRQQVGPADVADEQRVAGQDAPRLRALPLGDHDADRLGRVAGCGEHVEGHLAEGESLPVLQGLHGELGPGRGAVADHCPRRRGDLQVAGEEIRVEVGLDHPLDAQTLGRRIVEIPGDVALRIDDDRPAGCLVADQVAEERQAPELVLTEEHGPASLRLGPQY